MNVSELIQGCLQNDEKSQKELFDLYAGKMLAVCTRYCRHRMEAEDVVQEGFIKVFNKIEQFKNEGSIEYWIRRIMVNTAIKKMKKKSYQNELYGADPLVELSSRPAVYSQLSVDDMMIMVNELPEGYRMVFNLYAIEGFNHKEISEMLGIQESTSRSQLVKARKILQNRILKIEKTVA